MPFQSVVNTTLAPAVAGDFASHNPRATILAGPGGLVAGPSGVYVGRFGWIASNYMDPDNAGTVFTNSGYGPVGGFVARQNQGLNTVYLSDSSMFIPQGFPVVAYNEGDFWVVNSGSTYAQAGQYAYAAYATGLVSFATGASAASTVTAATSSVAASTFSVTGSITGNQMTVTAVGSGTIYPGATISGTSVSSGNQIVAQLSGTAGGAGVYAVTIGEQAVASTTISGTYGTLTLGATPSGQFLVGALLSGTGVAASTYVTAYIAGTGSVSGNTLVVNNNTVVSSTTISATTNVATKYIAMSSGAAGELIKISSWPLG